MISPRILFEGDPAEAYRYVGVAKEFGRSTFAAGILSKVWRLGEDVQIRVMNNIQARICKVWIRAGGGFKQFVARLTASTYPKLLYHRTRLKTEISIEPYWKVKQYPKVLDLGGFQLVAPGAFTDYPGQIGDIDWQNDTEVLTWFSVGKTGACRYQKPLLNLVNTYLYMKGKKTKSCSQKIVGACVNRLIGKRYIAVTVQSELGIQTLSIWSVSDFENDDWVLLQTLSPLEVDQELKTCVFFNHSSTEAVAALEYTTGATTKRLRIHLAKNSEGTALVITSSIENPYPDCSETGASNGFVATHSITGQSLMACDYFHIKNRTSTDEDVLIELVYQFNESSTRTNTYDSYVSDEGGTAYSQTAQEYTVARTGSYQIKRNGITILTLQDNYNDHYYYFADFAWYPARVTGGGVTTQDRYNIVDIDLRTLSLVVIWWDCEETQTAQGGTSYATDLVSTGSKKYQYIEPDSLGNFPISYLTLFEESQVYTRLIPGAGGGFSPPSWVGNGSLMTIYATYTAPASVDTTGIDFNGDWLVGHMKSLLRKGDTSSFLSYLYFRPESGSDYGNVPELTFTIYYLTDGDPIALASSGLAVAFPYDTFFTISVM